MATRLSPAPSVLGPQFLTLDRRGVMGNNQFSAANLKTVTILETLLTRGYFPKELPPAFFTEQLARYARTKKGRRALATYKAADNYTESAKYRLALPGVHRRELRLPHPASFVHLAALAAKNFRRLLKKASSSPFSRSRPIYATARHRALQPALKPSNLGRERAASRAGGSFLLKADVSQFYPSLYTHAVGWAIDPKLRKKAHWKNPNLLGKKLDQALMDLDGKVSQGIPIGNDISFLLAESVLAQVDAAISVPANRAFRWFDDYEIAFETRTEAEACLKRLSRELAGFRLRLNPTKTKIVDADAEGFDFLGYHFRGKLRLPRDKSLQKFKDAVRDKTKRTAGQCMPFLCARLSRQFRGWYAYFRHCHWSIFRDLDGWIRGRLRSVLRKRLHRRGRARRIDQQRWPNHFFDKLGLYSLSRAQVCFVQSSRR